MATLNEDNVEICPDNHRCENGSLCVESSVAEGKYFCDCEESMLNNARVFSGLYCQHEATSYCTTTQGKISHTAFCTNGATCIGFVDDNEEEHIGCDCPRGYTGKHCQFIEGSEGPELSALKPSSLTQGDVKNDRGGDGSGLGTAGLVVIILLVLALLSAVLAVAFRRQRQHAATHVIETTKSSDGNLPEADGSTTLQVPTKTQTFDSDHDDNHQLHTVDSGHLA